MATINESISFSVNVNTTEIAPTPGSLNFATTVNASYTKKRIKAPSAIYRRRHIGFTYG